MPTIRFPVDDVPEGEGRVVGGLDREFAVFKLKGRLYAMDNACGHRGGPLGEGLVEDGVVICPWHGWEFEIATGRSLVMPDMAQATFPVEVLGPEAEIRY
ncbi:MAG TPA: Rieske 2Fe-2S domain-containing protein [Candidatus Xenobia bacterium]|jgi:nitrite reductase/ring-hydroxylating ferredoxin subunit